MWACQNLRLENLVAVPTQLFQKERIKPAPSAD